MRTARREGEASDEVFAHAAEGVDRAVRSDWGHCEVAPMGELCRDERAHRGHAHFELIVVHAHHHESLPGDSSGVGGLRPVGDPLGG